MDHQIRAGARAALGLVHSHWSGVDFAQVVAGPPGGRDHPMNEHYMFVDKPARQVVRRVCEENDRHLGALIKEKLEPKGYVFPFVVCASSWWYIFHAVLVLSRGFVCVVVAGDVPEGCRGKPPSVKVFMCRGCEDRLGGWLLRRAPEC